MTTEILKSRAKRLRPAITKMFGVPVSAAQALELVAKEENFPNWDAAFACFKPCGNTSDKAVQLISTSLSVSHSAGLDVEEIFTSDPATLRNIRRQLDSKNNAGTLLLFSAKTGQGKTSTLHAVVSDLYQRQIDNEMELLHIGLQERSYPTGIHVQIENTKSVINKIARISLRLDGQVKPIIVVDEIRDAETAFVAIILADAGFKVLSTIHASNVDAVLNNVRLLLAKTVYCGSPTVDFLDKLVSNGCCTLVHQELMQAVVLKSDFDYWDDLAIKLISELTVSGEAFQATASRNDIAKVAGPWFTQASENTQESIIAVMRNILAVVAT